MNGAGQAAASAGAVAILGLPVVTAGAGGLADQAPAVEAPDPRTAKVTEVARLEDELDKATRAARYWRRKARGNFNRLRAVIRQGIDPVRLGLVCIHTGEGSWSAATGNGYWGGLQMDRGFMSTYGAPLVRRYGFAHRWPAQAQLAVAEVAFYSGRGYGPWPNTRKACGL